MEMVNRFSSLLILSLASLVLFSTGQGLAQTVNGSFRGTVADQTGGAVPGAVVRITNAGTGVARETKTDATGAYVVTNEAPSVYNFSVSFQGFATLQNPGVTLLVNQNATLDFTLQPSAVLQEITVKGQAPLANLVNATVSTVVEAQQVEELPLNGRQFSRLILLSPGAAPKENGQQSGWEVHSDYGAISPAVNGAGPEMNNFTIDGVENNELFFDFMVINPPPDAIQEFAVQTAMSSGQYGRGGGANVNVVTKSGTNQFHGAAWEFDRNTALNARNFFNPSVSAFHQNQFGGSFGGPIRKDKVWGFGWYEGFRKTVGSTILGLVPTAAQLSGDLSGQPPVFNPFTTTVVGTDAQGNPIFARTPFTNNRIPTALLNPTAQAVAKFVFPTPNYSAPGVNYLDTEPNLTTGNQFGIRIDAALNAKTTFFGRYSQDLGSRKTSRGMPSEPGHVIGMGVQQVLGLTRIISPTSVLDLRAQYLRSGQEMLTALAPVSFLQENHLIQDWPAQVDAPPNLPSMGISGGFSGVPGTYTSVAGNPQNNWQYTGTFSKVLGKHAIAVGASVIRTWMLDNCTYASAGFDPYGSDDPQNPTTTGAGLASFLLGVPSAASREWGDAEMNLYGNYYGVFADDVWKATPKLTVTLGLRYDYATPLHESRGRQSGLDYADSTATNTVWLDVSPNPLNGAPPNAPPGIYPPDRKDWGPRVALAYRLGHDLVLRSGYGIFYDFGQSSEQNQQTFMGQWPNGAPDDIYAGLNAPSVANPMPQHVLGVQVFPPFVPSATPPLNPGFAMDPTVYKRPSVQDWNFGIDKSFKNNWLVSASYLGNKGSHIVMNIPLNIADSPGPGDPQARARLPQIGVLDVPQDWGNSSYQALQAKVERKFSAGATLLVSYTHSKFLTYEDSANAGSGMQDALNFRADRAVSDYDLPDNLVVSYVYKLPFGSGGRFLTNRGWVSSRLLKGWETTGILTLRSGFPFNISVPFDNANVGGGNQRPTLVGQLLPPGFQQTIDHWFNVNAVTAIPYTFGNLGRNALRQEGVHGLDFGLFKATQLTESKSLEFRSEFFNLFNTPHFGAPDAGFTDANFGRVLGAGDPRLIQFGLKFIF
jgi:hypothetical protein